MQTPHPTPCSVFRERSHNSVSLLFSILLIFTLAAGCSSPQPAPATPAPSPTSAPVKPTGTPALESTATQPALTGTFPDRLGVDLGGILDDAILVDIGRGDRPWAKIDGSGPASVDDNDWPTEDASLVFFDLRPFGAWWTSDQSKCPECQDGDYLIDLSGTYKLSFKGQAVLTPIEGGGQVKNQRYDEASNTTTADIVVGHEKIGDNLLLIHFTETKRTPTSAKGTGITSVRLIRPGYEPDTTEVFTREILEAVKPFRVLRFMNWTGGNNVNPEYDPANPTGAMLDWSERSLPGDRPNAGEGAPWEYAILLANQANKDVWINIPIHASEDYIRELAKLMRATLHPGATIYLESSNEVWNSIFTQQKWNEAAAKDEVNRGDTALSRGSFTNESDWALRRHMRRVIQIGQIFAEEYGSRSIGAQVRPVFSWFFLFPDQYDKALAWAQEEYGSVPDRLYAVAAAPYFNIGENVSPTITLDGVFQRLKEGSDGSIDTKIKLNGIAKKYALKFALYEAGPDTAGSLQWGRSSELLATLIAAHRDERMKDAVLHDMRASWFQHPQLTEADVYIYFTLHSPYSRWGMWGLTEDLKNLQTPKFRAIYEIAGEQP